MTHVLKFSSLWIKLFMRKTLLYIKLISDFLNTKKLYILRVRHIMLPWQNYITLFLNTADVKMVSTYIRA